MSDEQVELLWIPLGSDGSRTVRASGRVYERIRAWLEGRPACAARCPVPTSSASEAEPSISWETVKSRLRWVTKGSRVTVTTLRRWAVPAA